MKKLILFDVDGTLIKTSNEHKKSFSYAFNKVHNIKTTIDIINYHGKTDQQIIKEVLIKKGLKKKFKLKECMNEMISYMKKQKIKVKLIYGVKKLIHKLEKKHILGLVTGNLEQIARLELKSLHLNHNFILGGFGSDGIKRSNLIKIAIKRAKKKFIFNEVFVIGDTPKDIIAGKEANVKTIAVATGIYSKNELKKYNPDYVFENLNNEKIIKIFS